MARNRQFPIIVGTEKNAPGNKFVDSLQTAELAPLLPVFLHRPQSTVKPMERIDIPSHQDSPQSTTADSANGGDHQAAPASAPPEPTPEGMK